MGDVQPSAENEDRALRLANEIRCEVCEWLLRSMLSRVKIFTEDVLYDMLEGNEEYEMTGNPIVDNVLKRKKGCQKHFKDDFILLGHFVTPCADNPKVACLEKGGPPGATARETYEVWKEGVYFACEQTIGAHSDEIVEILLDKGIDAKAHACLAAKCKKPTKRQVEL
eukprot:GEMP01061299.1.p1 GENE.GEMP01061299.1~~GEMP01061299.1.p1  ORF type:complete len:168 (+),score=26.28 GEMP01061299.1:303-806(+)